MTHFDYNLSVQIMRQNLPDSVRMEHGAAILSCMRQAVLGTKPDGSNIDDYLRAVEDGRRAGRAELQAELRALLDASKATQ